MAYRLRMPAEIGDWLTEVAGSQPEAAAETVAALLTLMAADGIPGPPLVTEPDRSDPVPADPRELLDQQYQQMLEVLQHVRREVADASASRKRTEIQLSAPDLDSVLRPVLERRLAAARQLEAALMQRGQRLHHVVDRFRTDKEVAKAMATATEAQARIKDMIATLDAMPDAAELDRAASESATRLEQVLAEARRLLALVQESVPNSGAPDAGRRSGDRDRLAAHTAAARSRSRPEGDVLELRPDPLGSDARIFFAEEPIGTITLLTALEDTDAVIAHRDMAVELACELLEEIRDDGWPTDTLQIDDSTALVARFLPGRESELFRRATAFGTATTLARLREQAGLTVPELAERPELNESRVKRLELEGARGAKVEVLAAYARALGGTLRLTVDLDGAEHIVL
jgi:phage shock protein A